MLFNCGVAEDSWESLNTNEIRPVNLKGRQPWIFIGRTDAEAQAPDAKSRLTGKRPWCWERWRAGREGGDRGHRRLSGYEFEQALGDGEGQGTLACCSPWGLKDSDTTEPLSISNSILSWSSHTWRKDTPDGFSDLMDFSEYCKRFF